MFQDGIWSVCFNVVVCARIQRRKEKKKRKKEKRIQRRKKKEFKKKEKEKEKCQKEENKKGSHQNFVKWNGRTEYCFEEEEVKKKLNGNSKKSWHSDKSWKHFLYLPLPIFISFPLLLPYITS